MFSEEVGNTQDAVKELAAWSDQWTMVEGRVACNVCREWQYPSDAGQEFIHADHCPSTSVSAFPWRDLKAILSLEV